MGEIAPLAAVVEADQRDILKHPVCESFLHFKWLLVKKFFYAYIVFYTVFLLRYFIIQNVCFNLDRNFKIFIDAHWFKIHSNVYSSHAKKMAQFLQKTFFVGLSPDHKSLIFLALHSSITKVLFFWHYFPQSQKSYFLALLSSITKVLFFQHYITFTKVFIFLALHSSITKVLFFLALHYIHKSFIFLALHSSITKVLFF